MPDFCLITDLQPSGDQPQAIAQLTAGLRQGLKHQVLLGATGTGKTFTISQVIQNVQRPTLVIAHNKTLAAQLYAEFRNLFPQNAVRYFVSYYDYYQPEAYLPQTDLYIEKDADINEEIDRLRHAATEAVSSRRDVIVVASVSCIYGMGSPEMYQKTKLTLQLGMQIARNQILHQLIDMQFLRNSMVAGPGQFRVRGDVVEICPAAGDRVIRVELFGDEVERILFLDPLTGEITAHCDHVTIYPATHYVTPQEHLEAILAAIRQEMEQRLEYFRSQNMLLEAQRLEQRTLYDLEIIRETGTCSGIENYSRYFDGRQPGEPAFTLLDYFPDDFLLVIDESHQTIPQLRAMWRGDQSRKDNLVRYGFRLPSAYDNRPLRFEEFEKRVNQVIYMSATPGPYELEKSQAVAEQIVRPTGLVDPEVEVRPTRGQVDDLIREIRERIGRGHRVLVTTLTKKMAENLSEYLSELQIKVRYLHSDVKTLDRAELLRDLRAGRYDVLVGVNLLREGLDLPEVSLIAILDADREGFLRSETSLIQTIGRAARNVDGKVIMYAEEVTDSMRRAIEETNRRRAKQTAYNELHGITPQTIQKAIRDLIEREPPLVAATEEEGRASLLPPAQLEEMIAEMEKQMFQAAERLDFEKAAELRDQIAELRAMLAQMTL